MHFVISDRKSFYFEVSYEIMKLIIYKKENDTNSKETRKKKNLSSNNLTILIHGN